MRCARCGGKLGFSGAHIIIIPDLGCKVLTYKCVEDITGQDMAEMMKAVQDFCSDKKNHWSQTFAVRPSFRPDHKDIQAQKNREARDMLDMARRHFPLNEQEMDNLEKEPLTFDELADKGDQANVVTLDEIMEMFK